MPIGKGVSLYLIDGHPSGRVACELSNWTGKAYKLPRARLKESLSRSELFKAGVYLLFGRDEEDPDGLIVYVGEAEEVYKRLLQHQDKDFWNDVVLFISKDDNLNKAHIKLLEFKIFDAIRVAGRAKLWNNNTPNQPVISELEQVVMDEFFENLKLLVGTLGYRVFEPLTRPTAAFQRGVVTAPEEPPTVESEYFLRGPRGADAQAIVTDEGLVIRKGSRAAAEVGQSLPPAKVALRERWLETGMTIVEDGQLVFARDFLASSPSAAATVLLGRSANGRIEWKDANGNTLKHNEESADGSDANPMAHD